MMMSKDLLPAWSRKDGRRCNSPSVFFLMNMRNPYYNLLFAWSLEAMAHHDDAVLLDGQDLLLATVTGSNSFRSGMTIAHMFQLKSANDNME